MDARKLAEDLLQYVKTSPECVHIADFFEGKGEDFYDFEELAQDDDECYKKLRRAKHAIGRALLRHALFEKCTPMHQHVIRYHMDDLQEFLLGTIKEEWEAKNSAEMSQANNRIEEMRQLLQFKGN